MPDTFHESRASICPTCLRLVSADVVQRDDSVVLEKRCPEHGSTSTRIAATYAWLAGLQALAPASTPALHRQTSVRNGCPLDCGECPEHRQRPAFFLLELTARCDLSCPVCLGDASACGAVPSLDEVRAMIRGVVDVAGPGQIISLGGGEPTSHPDFPAILRLLKDSGLNAIWLYTNGRRIAADPGLARLLAAEGIYVVLQWDGFSDDVYRTIRGCELVTEKQQALQNLRDAGAQVGLCPTVVAGVNDSELGGLYRKLVEDPIIGTLDIAPFAQVGRGAHFSGSRGPRLTAQDVLGHLEAQTGGALRSTDFSPISFAHPECLQIAYLLPLPDGRYVPLRRFLDPEDFRVLIMNKPLIALTSELEPVFRAVIDKLWARADRDPDTLDGIMALRYLVEALYPSGRGLSRDEFESVAKRHVKVVLVHSYMDRLCFDVGRSKMCISRTVQTDGRMIPTCAFSVVHREASQ